ncbi:LSM domain [Trypanosoma melophagium]|uniref:LSM domain n=1 Tax=Trypanosoma melophagium TaxID=715481 RepID=UPI003519E352|nr:LSM domain [Trypanosoma melophagium]
MPSAEGNTLVGFLQQLRGTAVEVELMNASVVSGEVVFVEPNMNTHLRHAKITARGANPVMADTYMVRGSSIRYVILPEALNTEEVLKKATAARGKTVS